MIPIRISFCIPMTISSLIFHGTGYIYKHVLYTHIRINTCRDLVHLDSSGPPGVSSRNLCSHPSTPYFLCVCVYVYTHTHQHTLPPALKKEKTQTTPLSFLLSKITPHAKQQVPSKTSWTLPSSFPNAEWTNCTYMSAYAHPVASVYAKCVLWCSQHLSNIHTCMCMVLTTPVEMYAFSPQKMHMHSCMCACATVQKLHCHGWPWPPTLLGFRLHEEWFRSFVYLLIDKGRIMEPYGCCDQCKVYVFRRRDRLRESRNKTLKNTSTIGSVMTNTSSHIESSKQFWVSM